VLLVTYTWAQDAQRLGSLVASDEIQLLQQIFIDLARLHPQVTVAQLREWYIDHKSWAWSNDANTSGAFALFGPGQFTTMYPTLIKSAGGGKVFFAGEATSAHHAWIVGAFNSAYRSVCEYLLHYGQWWKFMMLMWSEEFGGEDGTVLHNELETGEHGTLHLLALLGKLPPEERPLPWLPSRFSSRVDRFQ
jgi:hypothetical protein